MLTVEDSYKALRNLTRGVTGMNHDQHDAIEQCLDFLYQKAQEAEDATQECKDGNPSSGNDAG